MHAFGRDADIRFLTLAGLWIAVPQDFKGSMGSINIILYPWQMPDFAAPI
jgi:hypothetical protein